MTITANGATYEVKAGRRNETAARFTFWQAGQATNGISATFYFVPAPTDFDTMVVGWESDLDHRGNPLPTAVLEVLAKAEGLEVR